MDALAQLDEAEPVEADVGDVAADGLVDECLRRGAERQALGQADEALQLLRDSRTRGRVVGRDEVVDEATAIAPGLDADLFLAELVDDVVAAARPGRAGLAVADVGAGEDLELEGDVLGDVARPGAVAQAGQEATAPAERAGVVLERRHELDSPSTNPGIVLDG